MPIFSFIVECEMVAAHATFMQLNLSHDVSESLFKCQNFQNSAELFQWAVKRLSTQTLLQSSRKTRRWYVVDCLVYDEMCSRNEFGLIRNGKAVLKPQ